MWFDTRQVANLRRPTLFLLDWARRATYAKSLAAEPTRSMTSRVGRQGGPVAQRMRAPMRAVVLLTRVRSHSEARCAYSKELAPVHCSLRICASPFCLPLIGALFCIMTPPPHCPVPVVGVGNLLRAPLGGTGAQHCIALQALGWRRYRGRFTANPNAHHMCSAGAHVPQVPSTHSLPSV